CQQHGNRPHLTF
nr:immunoglobulin light chain junction region [Macaca mulatta]